MTVFIVAASWQAASTPLPMDTVTVAEARSARAARVAYKGQSVKDGGIHSLVRHAFWPT